MDANEWNDAERRVERAQELFEQHKWQEALEELRAATDINPYNSVWYFNIGLTLDELSRHDEAIEAYRQALAIEPDDVPTLHRLGVDLHRVGRFRDAILSFENIQRIDPGFEPSYCGRIFCYAELGQHQKAEEMFYLARLYKEQCPECDHAMGLSCSARGMHERAIVLWRRALDEGRSEAAAELHARIAGALWDRGDLENARRHFVLSMREDPGFVPTMLGLSELLTDMKRLDEAGEKIRQAIELSPDDPAAHCALGRWLVHQHRTSDAVEAFTKALSLDPTFPTAHLGLGAIAAGSGDLGIAAKHLRSELLLRPEDPVSLMELGNLLIDVDESRAAVACFKRLTQIQPNRPTAWLNLGVAQFLRGRFAEGVSACEEASRLDPTSVMPLYNLALAFGQRGFFADAFRYAREGLQTAPREPSLQKLMFRLRIWRSTAAVKGLARRIVSAIKTLFPKSSRP